MVMWISWLGAVGFSIFVTAFVAALINPKNALSPEDAAAIRKLIRKEDD